MDTPNFGEMGVGSWELGVGVASQRSSPAGTLPRLPAPDPRLPPFLVTPAWVAARRADWGEESLSYRVRVLAEFPLAATDALIEPAWVEAAEGRGMGVGSWESGHSEPASASG